MIVKKHHNWGGFCSPFQTAPWPRAIETILRSSSWNSYGSMGCFPISMGYHNPQMRNCIRCIYTSPTIHHSPSPKNYWWLPFNINSPRITYQHHGDHFHHPRLVVCSAWHRCNMARTSESFVRSWVYEISWKMVASMVDQWWVNGGLMGFEGIQWDLYHGKFMGLNGACSNDLTNTNADLHSNKLT